MKLHHGPAILFSAMEPDRHDAIILHVLYVTMTRWIPVPFVDTLAANYLRRVFVERLAAGRRAQFDNPAIAALANEEFGCLYGCVMAILLLPFRLLFGLLFLLWGMKIAIDKASREYHKARLLDYAFVEDIATQQNANQLRAVIDSVCRSANIAPIEGAFRAVFRAQGGVLKSAARPFVSAFVRIRGARRSEEEVAAATERAENLAKEKVSGLIAPLRAALDAVPDSHFKTLEEELRNRMAAGIK